MQVSDVAATVARLPSSPESSSAGATVDRVIAAVSGPDSGCNGLVSPVSLPSPEINLYTHPGHRKAVQAQHVRRSAGSAAGAEMHPSARDASSAHLRDQLCGYFMDIP